LKNDVVFSDISGVEMFDCDVLYFVDFTSVFNRIILADSQNEAVDVNCVLLISKT